MSSKAMSLKAKIRTLSKEKHISPQVILQNYMFERFLERIALSEYKDKLVIKGGMLIAAMVGLATRTTMDLDVTIRAWPLDEEHIREIMEKICSLAVNDDIEFSFVRITPIHNNDEYGGLRVSLQAVYDTISTPLSLDITSGDAITPHAIRYCFGSIFDTEKRIELWAYNIETVLAEKTETILRRGIFNTRPRDLYDVYILVKTQNFEPEVFKAAFEATQKHRNTTEQIKDIPSILNTIENSEELRGYWKKYQREYPYAGEVSYEEIIKVLRNLLQGGQE
ncbi:abortive infection protein [Spirochaetia bacterium]|nr:abortive infection protein [Spirochaetia bacterium]